jgi:NADH-quinone oxidoreductase subunit C
MNSLSKEFVVERLQKKFPESYFKVEEPADFLTIEVDADLAHKIIKFLKEDSELNINFLTLLGGIHYPKNEGKELGVTYHLHNLQANFRIRLKTFIPIEKPEIKSIVDLYVGANWQERETFDFFGVQFIGHPNLTRILNEDSMDYFPMRKEYHLEDATREDKDDRFFGR